LLKFHISSTDSHVAQWWSYQWVMEVVTVVETETETRKQKGDPSITCTGIRLVHIGQYEINHLPGYTFC
jgi:hypothetical protein